MAADEVLLESAAGGVASLRFYTWAEATLSLGYFQAEAACRADPRLAGLPWVRRASGGEALVHHHEVTYALALPPSWPKPGPGWLRSMHGVIAAALADLGVAVRACGDGEEKKRGEDPEFLHQAPHTLGLSRPDEVKAAKEPVLRWKTS